MSNQYYTHGSFPSTGAAATSASMRAELDLVSAGFDKLPALTGNANKFVVVNSTATGLTTTGTLPMATVNDNAFTFQDEADNSRKFQFRADGISPGATRYFTMPDADTTLVGTDTTQTLTNKTLTSPVIGTIVNTGTLTLPTSTDTLVGRNTTDTLTNKTLTNPVIGTIINTGTLTLPTSTDTLVGRATSDTLTNKTISGATNVLSNIANASLSNSAVTIGSSSLSLGGTLTALQGVSISGAVNTLTNIPNTALTNSGVTFNGTTVALGGSATIKASTTNALTIGNGLSGTSFDGGSAVTIAINTGVTADLSTAQTFSNKTISGAANTLTNIGNASLTNSQVTIGSTSISLGATATALAGLASVTVTGDPTSALQLATKQYVDNVAQGLNVKASVAWSTTANISLLGLATQVGGEWPSALNAGDRILVKNQTVASQNGIYAASATGWSRTADADTWNELVSAFVFVSQGATMGDTGWVCTADPGGTLGTNNLPWSQFSGAGTYTAGNGLTLSGTQFSINTGVTADLSTAQTLTNKTISGSSNTLSNIANSSLTNSAITFGSTAQALGSTVSAIDGVSVGTTTPAAGAFTTLSASGAVTLSAGTANGVAYLNGSKVLTTGGALTFDGTTFAAPLTSLSGNGVVLTVDRTGTGGNDRTNVQFSNSGTVRGGIGTVGASDGIYFNYGTTEGMRLTSTGLGIATANPVASLTVVGTGALLSGTSPALSATDPAYSGVAFGFDGASNLGQVISTNASGAALGFYTKSGGGSAPAQRMHITGGGLVLIGTTSTTETAQLYVNGAKTISSGIPLNQIGAADSSALAAGVGGAINFIGVYTSGGAQTSFASIEARKDNATSGAFGASMIFKTRVDGGAQIERLRVTSTGNAGLGVTPSDWLWPDGSTGVLQLQAGAAFSGYNAGAVMSQNWYYNANERFIGNGWATRYSQASGVHSWSSSTASNSSGAGAVLTWAESMRITTGGRISMGNSSTPQGRLGVFGLTGGSIELSLDSNPNYGEIQTYSSKPLYLQRQGNNTYSNVGGGAFYVGKDNDDITDNGWSFGAIGTGGTNFTITNNEFFTWNNYNGSGSVQMDFRWNNTEVGSIAYTSSSVSFNQTSDYRLKDDPQPLTNSGAFIDALKPKVWKWKIDGSRGVGFLAHEAQEVSPLSVTGEKDAMRDDGVTPKYQSVAYGSPEFIANIVLELQSLRKRLADAGIA